MAGEFSYIKNNEGCAEGNFLTDTGGIERSSAGQRIAPLLFLLFVNELLAWIKSEMKMFADDTNV